MLGSSCMMYDGKDSAVRAAICRIVCNYQPLVWRIKELREVLVMK